MRYIQKILSIDKRILLFLIIVTGMLMQLAVVFLLMEPNKLTWVDPNWIYSVAKDLANGIPFSTPENDINLPLSPGYPAFLAAIILILGESVFAVRIVHILLFPVFILSVYHIGKRFKNEKLGLIFATLCLLYPYHIYVPMTLYTESVTLYFFPLFILLTMKLRENFKISDAIYMAMVSGFLIMCRPTNVYIIPVSLFYVFWRNKITPRKLLIYSITVMVPVILVFSWMSRNKKIHGEFIFSTGASYVLQASYNESVIPGKKNWPVYSEALKKEREKAKNELEDAKIMGKYAKKFIKENPAKALKIASFNILNYWNPIPPTYGEEGERMQQFKIIPGSIYLILIILGILGYIKNRNLLLANSILILLVFNTLLNAPFMVSVRYRLVVDFSFILLSSTVIYWVLKKTKFRIPNPK